MLPRGSYLPTRPQSIGEVLDTGFRIFQSTLLRSLPYGVLWVIAGQLANIHDLAAGRPLRTFGAADRIWWLWSGLAMLLTLFIWTAMILRQSALVSGKASSMRAELAMTLSMMPQLVALAMLAAAGCALGLILLIVPGVYLLVAFTFAVPALLARGSGPLDAVTYCARLVSGNWWRTVFILAVAAVIVLVLYTVLATTALLAFTAVGIADLALVTAISRAVGIALGAVIAPFACAMILATFAELRARRDGLDIESRWGAGACGAGP